MNGAKINPLLLALNNAPAILFACVLLVFGVSVRGFLTPDNLVNIVSQASATAIVAIGMTFVLLTAGVDLSVGAIMFVAAAIAGKMSLAGAPFGAALAMILATGVVYGAINAFCIVQLRIIAFIVTLATLFIGRGLGLWITKTRAINLPENFLELGQARIADVPVPILILAAVLLIAHWVLVRTPFGRQVHAVGQDIEAARKAGIHTRRILFTVYVISGFCAALGGVLSLAQLGAVSPTFGLNKEFSAIAAAVLGGTSLFGGRGKVFPGTLLGALLIQSVEAGLVMKNANVYLYPLITSAIIFIAVLTDTLRGSLIEKLNRRKIRIESADSEPCPAPGLGLRGH